MSRSQLLKWWPIIAALGGFTVMTGGAGVYAAVTDHNAIARNSAKIEDLEVVIPKMQADISVICWAVSRGRGCSNEQYFNP